MRQASSRSRRGSRGKSFAGSPWPEELLEELAVHDHVETGRKRGNVVIDLGA